MNQTNLTWDEKNSETFIDHGRYLVPDREIQIQTICRLIPATDEPFFVMELSHGEGLLAEAILEGYPQATVHGYDISETMRQAAGQKLAHFGNRFQTHHFDMRDLTWRSPNFAPWAVVSSLAVHHLDGPEKLRLFLDMNAILTSGGALILADLIEPANAYGNRIAAEGWDTAVKERAQQLDGNDKAFTAFEKLEWNLFRYPDPEFDKPSRIFDQLKWLEQAGFTAVDVFWLRAGHAIYGGYKA